MVTYGGRVRFGTPNAGPLPGPNPLARLHNFACGLDRIRNAGGLFLEKKPSWRKGRIEEKTTLHPLLMVLMAGREARMQ